MLILKNCIGKGASRECYEHPTDQNKCVKVLIGNADKSLFQREYDNYSAVKDVLGDYVVSCEKELVETNKGLGMVFELLRDDDGSVSKLIFKYGEPEELKRLFDDFIKILFANDLFFYDFNLNNFVLQIKNGKKKLKFIDLKSYRRNKSWCFLKMENHFAPLARIMMRRRAKKIDNIFDESIANLALNHSKTTS